MSSETKAPTTSRINWWCVRVIIALLAAPLFSWALMLPREPGDPSFTPITRILLGVAFASLIAISLRPEKLPARLHREFTTVKLTPQIITLRSSWVAWTIVGFPLLVFGLADAVAGLLDHSVFPDRPLMELKYTMVGVLGVGVTTWMAVIMPSGYRAVVTGNRLRWTWTYFGRDAVIRDYPGAVLMKYSNTNSGGMSGPEFYIEYDHRSGVRKRKRIRLRNLVNMTPDEFQPLLAAQLSPLDGVAGSDAASADADPDALGSD